MNNSRPPLRMIAPLVLGLCGIFIMSQFYRSALAVIAPDLARELRLSPEALGLLTGTFFMGIAAMQLPVGLLLDRFGPRRVVPSLLLLTVAGATLFALSHDLATLVAGQALIGFGCAGIFMGGLVTFARWFPPHQFATVAAVSMGVSGAGTILSATPFAAAAEAIGWRGAYGATAGITAVLGLIVLVVLRDAPPGHPFHNREQESLRQALRGIGEVVRHPHIWGILAIAFVTYASVISVRGLWGGPYLADVHGLGPLDRGNVLLLMSIAMVSGTLTYGPLDRVFRTRKRLVVTGAAILAAALCALAAIAHPPLWAVTTLFCVAALGGAYFVHLLGHGRAFFPDRLTGRVLTTVNFANFLGVGVLQLATGLLLGHLAGPAEPAPEEAYRAVFALLAAFVVAGAAMYLRVRDMPPGRRPPRD